MIEIIPNWHPVFVHFTVALFSTAVGFFLLAALWPRNKWHDAWLTVAHWNLWVGIAITLVTVAAGWYAFNTVNHDDTSHEVMVEHRNLALVTLVLFLAIAAWSLAKVRVAKPVSWLFLGGLLVAQGLLASTAWHGGELVYRYGLGVQSLPKVEAHHHSPGGESPAPHEDGHEP